ncbi:MAG: NADP-specific glutamate dehydrogenase [Candidatus Nitronauta litoralis]|uniref:Glutamate dehydrogenase n=1 Tax=Candidatus Nitronauta litoralis TaxID=2705533 RepID=A0A7T0BZX9_9BACT|nr:MAG: NADP-specific glutamate dehydrogenase [Candidatus Nitronauta litoralis]
MENLSLENFMHGLVRRNPGEAEFHQAVEEVAGYLIPYIKEHPIYFESRILERLTEPDRILIFRVSWVDDEGNVRTSRGYRVQFNNSIGPYKGGLRFHPSVNLSILKFLGFEQIFKNSLTTLPIGAGKGGSNFNPKGKSDAEVMRFCQSFMTELSKHIGENIDVPAGDIGVGSREISFLFGQYKRIKNEFTGSMTGKGLEFGGSQIRKEATGFGCIYFMQEMLRHEGKTLEDKVCVISGSGNVAQYAAIKLIQLGAKVVTLSDSTGFVHDPDGLSQDKIDYIIESKTKRHESLSIFAKEFKLKFHKEKRPWKIPCDYAFPCATQNEIEKSDAEDLIKNGCDGIAEGANMPVTGEAITVFNNAKKLYAPGKASNAGGVAISGLEMTQNSIRMSWSHEELDNHLQGIMKKIHQQCVDYGMENGYVNYVKGANIAGFKKVADAMLAYGVV